MSGARTVELRAGEESIRLGPVQRLAPSVRGVRRTGSFLLLGGDVLVNGEPEERRGRQLRRGDVVTVAGLGDVRLV
jgi:ribosome-associated protein